MLLYKAWIESRWRFICGAVAVTALSILFVRLHPILIPQWQVALQDPYAYKPRWLPLGVSDYRFYIWHFLFDFRLQNLWRSEERRVGKEGRSGWSSEIFIK